MRDSEQETLKHIRRVQSLMLELTTNLLERARLHDASKLLEPEASVFDKFTEKLKNTTYGSEEYKRYLAEMKPALEHHYKHNRHHPEHWENGIFDMSLLDMLEMLVDWKAASERHSDGDVRKSIEINADRFGYTDDYLAIFRKTVDELWPK